VANLVLFKDPREGSPVLAALDCDSTFGRVLGAMGGVFTRPTFVTFLAMAVGMVCQVGECTVTGMLQASGMAGVWHHGRAHRFFSRAAWCLDQLGLQVMVLAMDRLVPADAPLRLVVDDTLFRRSGRKVAHAFWQHDGASDAAAHIGFGNNFEAPPN
jgi:hypothetical protein